MSEAQAQSFDGAKQQRLWDQAPGWRNLVITASLLTTVALALPLMPEPAAKSAAIAAQPRPHPVQTATLAPAPAKPVLAPITPAPVAPAPAAPAPATPVRPALHTAIVKPVTAHAAPSTPAAQPATAQPATAQPAPATASPPAQLASAAPQPTPSTAAEPATADPSKVCLLNGPLAPHPQDVGRVVAFEDRAMALARIQLTQSISHGQIDPAYVDNQRVHIDLGNGHIRVVLVPRGMTVSMGDIVMVQSGYRNMSLPCNYVPNLITSDLGPQGNRPPPSQVPAQSPPQTPSLQH